MALCAVSWLSYTSHYRFLARQAIILALKYVVSHPRDFMLVFGVSFLVGRGDGFRLLVAHFDLSVKLVKVGLVRVSAQASM